jgi:hypothetical protein
VRGRAFGWSRHGLRDALLRLTITRIFSAVFRQFYGFP